VEHWPKLEATAKGGDILIRSCAIFDSLLQQLKLPRLTTMKPADHAALAQALTALDPVRLTIHGYDVARRHDRQVFDLVRRQLFLRLADEIEQETRQIEQDFVGGGPRIAIVARLPPDKFYASRECEARGSGAQRRSIPNFDELCATVHDLSDNMLVTALEGRSLYYQMALFSSVDIVICQHGAALANLIWAKPGTQLIEIIPDSMPPGQQGTFVRLADCLGIEHRRLSQSSLHAPVDAATLSRLVKATIGKERSAHRR
jgi:hypothetical protein